MKNKGKETGGNEVTCFSESEVDAGSVVAAVDAIVLLLLLLEDAGYLLDEDRVLE